MSMDNDEISQENSVSFQIKRMLAKLASSSSKPFIYKVHKPLRCINENAYEPEIIAIGPYHHGKLNLEMMEEHKLRYLHQLLERKDETNADKYILLLRTLQLDARRYYAESINFTDDEFIKMLLLDSCFIIEIFHKFYSPHLRSNGDPIFQMDWIRNGLQRDLMLFENQLPLDVLCKLFDLIEVPGSYGMFKNLALEFFKDLWVGSGYRTYGSTDSVVNDKHLLGLIHNNWRPFVHKDSDDFPYTILRFIPSATELRECGVKIIMAEEGSLFDITFLNGVLRVPPLRVDNRTETFLRNLVAYEEYSGVHNRYVTDYVIFFDCLINSAADVEMLRDCGVIDNWLGDNVVVSDIFNKITDGVTGPRLTYFYAVVFNKLNQHCGQRKNKWLAKLRRDYLGTPWRIISLLAALILLLLTVTQTTFTIISYFKAK